MCNIKKNRNLFIPSISLIQRQGMKTNLFLLFFARSSTTSSPSSAPRFTKNKEKKKKKLKKKKKTTKWKYFYNIIIFLLIFCALIHNFHILFTSFFFFVEFLWKIKKGTFIFSPPKTTHLPSYPMFFILLPMLSHGYHSISFRHLYLQALNSHYPCLNEF